jgi:prephenate dehydratase
MHAMAKHVFAIETMFEIDIHHVLMVRDGIKGEDITLITSHE